jgi:hypothetical protein
MVLSGNLLVLRQRSVGSPREEPAGMRRRRRALLILHNELPECCRQFTTLPVEEAAPK